MSYVLNLQSADDRGQDDRSWSTWSLIGCASTASVGIC